MPSLGFKMEAWSQSLKFLSSFLKQFYNQPYYFFFFWDYIQLQIFSTVLFLILIYSAINSNNMQKEALLKNKYYPLAYKSGTADTVSG